MHPGSRERASAYYPWSYGHCIIYREDWNSISASSCFRKTSSLYGVCTVLVEWAAG
jgi:hypothetical protein